MWDSPINLIGYYLREVEFNIKPGFEAVEHIQIPGLGLQLSSPLVVSPLKVSTNFTIQQHKELERHYRIELTVKSTQGKSSDYPYQFKITVIGIFSVDPEYKEDMIPALVSINGPSILYSSSREMLAAISGRSKGPAIHLPTVSFVPREKERTKSSRKRKR